MYTIFDESGKIRGQVADHTVATACLLNRHRMRQFTNCGKITFLVKSSFHIGEGMVKIKCRRNYSLVEVKKS